MAIQLHSLGKQIGRNEDDMEVIFPTIHIDTDKIPGLAQKKIGEPIMMTVMARVKMMAEENEDDEKKLVIGLELIAADMVSNTNKSDRTKKLRGVITEKPNSNSVPQPPAFMIGGQF